MNKLWSVLEINQSLRDELSSSSSSGSSSLIDKHILQQDAPATSSLWGEISTDCIKLHRQHLSSGAFLSKVRNPTNTFSCLNAPNGATTPRDASRGWWWEMRPWVAGSARSARPAFCSLKTKGFYKHRVLSEWVVPKVCKVITQWCQKSVQLKLRAWTFTALRRSSVSLRHYQHWVTTTPWKNTVPEPTQAAVKLL